MDEVLNFDNGWIIIEMYDVMIDEFFELLGVDGVMKKLMVESGEVWILICGMFLFIVKVWCRIFIKNDCVFVIVDNEFFLVMFGVLIFKNILNLINKLLGILGFGGIWMKYM